MMLIGRSSRRENLLWVTGVEPMPLIRTRLANHIRASSREQWLHQQARHMTAPTAIVPMPNIVLDRKAPSTHDPIAAIPSSAARLGDGSGKEWCAALVLLWLHG